MKFGFGEIERNFTSSIVLTFSIRTHVDIKDDELVPVKVQSSNGNQNKSEYSNSTQLAISKHTAFLWSISLVNEYNSWMFYNLSNS